ncbi:MAG: hypothetical protein SGJ21_05635 [Alphaproteobacteria bacterium]|nr:hypothetical protein [Alphaproteobacteria bacterium]
MTNTRPLISFFVALGLAAGPLCGALAQPAPGWTTPRTPDGRPDLQGVWTNSSITLLERGDASLPLSLSPDQATRMERSRAAQEAAANGPTNPEEGAPQSGGAIGGYNAFWLDRGDRVGRVKGEARSSWIVEPANGRIPVSEEGRKRIAAITAKRNEDGPEGMNPADRCLVGSRGSGGPPMLNNIYNNTYQIVQTPGNIMINVEMMHDARIVRVGEGHKPGPLQQWLGDSVGRWDGDTLVVETRNWKTDHASYEPVFLSGAGSVTERFTRTGPSEILYEFTVEDPTFYTQPWRGEMTFFPSSGPVYEFACHEGNYALKGILSGARVTGRKAGR